MTADKTGEDRPTIDESYSAVGSSGNLSRGQTDLLLASGMSRSVAGAAIMQLLGECDGIAHRDTRTIAGMRSLAPGMRSMGHALSQVQILAICNGIEGHYAPEVLYWMLAPRCRHCNGSGRTRTMANCVMCKNGTTAVPYGKAGQRLVALMEEAVNDWRGQLQKKLRTR